MKFRRYSPPIPVDESKLSNAAYPTPPSGVKRTQKDYGLGQSANRIPIASESTVNKEMKTIFLKHKLGFFSVAFLTLLTVVASLVPPRVFGNFLQTLQNNPEDAQIGQVIGIVGLAIVIRTIFSYFTNVRASVLGEFILSSVRERFVEKVIEIPPNAAERAGSGELLSRTTTDVDHITWAMRDAVPIISICLIQIIGISAAIMATAPVFMLATLAILPIVGISTRWYLQRSPQAYRIQSSAYSTVNSVLIETADSGRTIDALRLGNDRNERTHAASSRWLEWERYTLNLRVRWFPTIEVNSVLPAALVLAFGAIFYSIDSSKPGYIGIATITAGVLYAQMMIQPIEELLWCIDELQTGKASLGRLFGINEIPQREIKDAQPEGKTIESVNVRYGYREGKDVLKDISFLLKPGTRLAIVGPSGAGKSTLGRLLAGLQPPNLGKITIGKAEIGYLPVEQARMEVALVTQEQHVFIGTLRQNVSLAKPDVSDDEIWRALEAVDAAGWAIGLEKGLDTIVGSGGARLLPAQAQQIALSRLVLADPHTLILDEATSLLDQRAAKHLENSLAAVLAGRTVIAIAHRLQTAFDADLIAVIEDGQISEWGSHNDLMAANGAYAKLWRSWRDES
jgi:ABC-type multidrug transport system fused ATPase/permease subunit